jgi:hypothetical protein
MAAFGTESLTFRKLNLKRRDTSETLLDGRKILKWILKEWVVRIWNGFVWFRTGTSGPSWSGSIKCEKFLD